MNRQVIPSHPQIPGVRDPLQQAGTDLSYACFAPTDRLSNGLLMTGKKVTGLAAVAVDSLLAKVPSGESRVHINLIRTGIPVLLAEVLRQGGRSDRPPATALNCREFVNGKRSCQSKVGKVVVGK